MMDIDLLVSLVAGRFWTWMLRAFSFCGCLGSGFDFTSVRDELNPFQVSTGRRSKCPEWCRRKSCDPRCRSKRSMDSMEIGRNMMFMRLSSQKNPDRNCVAFDFVGSCTVISRKSHIKHPQSLRTLLPWSRFASCVYCSRAHGTLRRRALKALGWLLLAGGFGRMWHIQCHKLPRMLKTDYWW